MLRIITHISDQRLVDCFQSANRKKNEKTETALLYVTSASKTSTDNEQGTTLIPVDFNAAFDTMKHDISISLVIHKPNVCATAPRPEGSPRHKRPEGYIKNATQKKCVAIGHGVGHCPEITNRSGQKVHLLTPRLKTVSNIPVGLSENGITNVSNFMWAFPCQQTHRVRKGHSFTGKTLS